MKAQKLFEIIGSEFYTGDDVINAFHAAYSWSESGWSQETWHRFHELLQGADLNTESLDTGRGLSPRRMSPALSMAQMLQ